MGQCLASEVGSLCGRVPSFVHRLVHACRPQERDTDAAIWQGRRLPAGTQPARQTVGFQAAVSLMLACSSHPKTTLLLCPCRQAGRGAACVRHLP